VNTVNELFNRFCARKDFRINVKNEVPGKIKNKLRDLLVSYSLHSVFPNIKIE